MITDLAWRPCLYDHGKEDGTSRTLVLATQHAAGTAGHPGNAGHARAGEPCNKDMMVLAHSMD